MTDPRDKPKFKVKKPRIPAYYVATKGGKICAKSQRKIDIIAWKRAFGASMWKATTVFETFEDTGP